MGSADVWSTLDSPGNTVGTGSTGTVEGEVTQPSPPAWVAGGLPESLQNRDVLLHQFIHQLHWASLICQAFAGVVLWAGGSLGG